MTTEERRAAFIAGLRAITVRWTAEVEERAHRWARNLYPEAE